MFKCLQSTRHFAEPNQRLSLTFCLLKYLLFAIDFTSMAQAPGKKSVGNNGLKIKYKVKLLLKFLFIWVLAHKIGQRFICKTFSNFSKRDGTIRRGQRACPSINCRVKTHLVIKLLNVVPGIVLKLSYKIILFHFYDSLDFVFLHFQHWVLKMVENNYVRI